MRIFQEPSRKYIFAIKETIPNWYKIFFAISVLIILMILIFVNTYKYAYKLTLDGILLEYEGNLSAQLYMPTKFVNYLDVGSNITLYLDIYPRQNNTMQSTIQRISYEQNITSNLNKQNIYYLVTTRPISHTLYGKKLHEGITVKAEIILEERYLFQWLTATE